MLLPRFLSFTAALIFSAALSSTVLAGSISGSVPARFVAVWIEGDLPNEPAENRVQISQRGVKFDPDFAVVRVGQAVVMPNDDSVAHNVYSLSPGGKFNLGIYPEGESRSVTFDKPGVVSVRCWLHERMRATIIVVPNRFYSIAASGKFRIAALPAGTYTIVAAGQDEPEITRTVTVPATGNVIVNF